MIKASELNFKIKIQAFMGIHSAFPRKSLTSMTYPGEAFAQKKVCLPTYEKRACVWLGSDALVSILLNNNKHKH